MIRIILFLIALAAISAGVAWLADRPGQVSIVWQGYEIETSLLVMAAALLALVVAILVTWTILRTVLRLPDLLVLGARNRRRNRGFAALSRGIIAAGAGDPRVARRASDEATRYLGPEPLTLLLKAQAAQLAGDRGGAEAAFNAMADRPDTRLLGLRGLWMEAQRRNDLAAARAIAETAADEAPGLPWATQAALETRAASGDWRGALQALDRASRTGGEATANRRTRAVLLTADAIQREAGEPDAAREAALEAVRLAPGLEPAAAVAARLLARAGEHRKAGKILETAWRAMPHPEIADTYVHLREGDSARERLARARALARLTPDDREGQLAVMRAALDAADYPAARAAAERLLSEPSQRTFLLMAELEAAEHGNVGRAREWAARAVRAKRDPVWVADGFVSERWLPVSPVSGKIDAFEWKVPVAEIGGPVLDNAVETALTVVEAAAASQLPPPAAPVAATPPATATQPEPEPPPRPEPTARAATAAASTQPAPAKAEPARAEPVTVEPLKVEPAKPPAWWREPARAEPVRTEPARTEPAKPEPARIEAAAVDAGRAATPATAPPAVAPSVAAAPAAPLAAPPAVAPSTEAEAVEPKPGLGNFLRPVVVPEPAEEVARGNGAGSYYMRTVTVPAGPTPPYYMRPEPAAEPAPEPEVAPPHPPDDPGPEPEPPAVAPPARKRFRLFG